MARNVSCSGGSLSRHGRGESGKSDRSIRVLIKTLSENLVEAGSKFVLSGHILDIWLLDKAGLVSAFLGILRKIPTLIIFNHLNVSQTP